jgi:hypothetical protein
MEKGFCGFSFKGNRQFYWFLENRCENITDARGLNRFFVDGENVFNWEDKMTHLMKDGVYSTKYERVIHRL